jgi:hypothetical protein
MAQTYNKFGNPSSFVAANTNLFVTSAESIILSDISVAGFSQLSLTVTNTANSAATISTIKVYGSNDKQNYFTINAAALSTITASSTVNYTFSNVVLFIRVSAISASNSHLDCYLVGLPI